MAHPKAHPKRHSFVSLAPNKPKRRRINSNPFSLNSFHLLPLLASPATTIASINVIVACSSSSLSIMILAHSRDDHFKPQVFCPSIPSLNVFHHVHAPQLA
ncbi:hypothetical protein PIB30_074751, partial [Stylosanthes scabra]|nr:hypothetical protein [Stylosanthes scabra]